VTNVATNITTVNNRHTKSLPKSLPPRSMDAPRLSNLPSGFNQRRSTSINIDQRRLTRPPPANNPANNSAL
jgi:hypothetical protein